MSYWKRYRMNIAAISALADSSSGEDYDSDRALEQQRDVARVQEEDLNVNTDLSDDNRENLSDFDFSGTVESSDSECSLSENEDSVNTLRENLASWDSKNNQSKSSVDELLTILRPHCCDLPKDSRTLLRTPKSIEFTERCGGKYIYFGIKTGVMNVIAQKSFSPNSLCENTLKLNFNIDGIPVFKSTGTPFWPILCSLENYTPFMVSIFYGESKPNSLQDFLRDFIAELGELNEGILFEGKLFNVKANAFICDAPARAFLKNIKGHTGYDSCERCTIHGYYKDNRVVLHSDEVFPCRTDDEFQALGYRGHQTGETPLMASDVSCVTAFCLDYMHMVCLGVVKRILWFLRQGPKDCKLSSLQVSQISNSLISFCGKLPSEFARQPRTLFDIERWKATEFRQFLLYTGTVVLKKVLSKEMYEHFLTLTVGVPILLESDDETRTLYLNYARDILNYFVKKSQVFYGEKFIVYNVHSIVHLADDCEKFKCSLNGISGFPFENHLQSIRKLVKNAKNPIVQVAKRMQEKNSSAVLAVRKKPTFNMITTKERNNCFLLRNGTYAFVKGKIDNKVYMCQILKPEQTEIFFTQPCESKLLNIVYVKNNQRMKRKRIDVSQLYKKLVRLPLDRGLVLIPLLHTIELW